MPGSPDPVLGNWLLTHVVAVVAALATVGVVYATRTRSARGYLTSLLLGAGYATATLAVWTAARLVTGAFPSGFENPVTAAGFLGLVFLLLAGFVVVAALLFARFGLVIPLIGLFGITELVWWAFLHVRGETDALGMFLIFGPLFLVLLVAVSVVEYAGRRLWSRFGNGGGSGRSTV
ncbi:hypothetical protein E6P09_12290 [Haloferax mediterranei ATCC 33500]|uniref:Uncharacterized protein n=1 Tax=Haloferax mediterranei (strain ATCC 33500 / DSM 1411 / JCM 8866 / NBRC 14739 / NCIMB 2177 / R-4) TaxID=523841 RepID=M0INF3_HALMT|nr:hypothetical protein [Haloferax mediterranei]AHZ23926.1 hypothetical protein BM92_15290 [Haloferax mediterranei ATCC 33500]ELZ98351.1 hypothetical protein C439_16240 [Haloferax mediterranei ATCC 33500]MDX5986675.1 hypothetical protein [Haloferax mediterranei ATCC 33500]QCQ76006.1 hypothetical protein E6P09_12290 [Haloferax mediterranei ATCC 33500]